MKRGISPWRMLRLQIFLLGFWDGIRAWISIERRIRKDRQVLLDIEKDDREIRGLAQEISDIPVNPAEGNAK